jgi:hypothetical protein
MRVAIDGCFSLPCRLFGACMGVCAGVGIPSMRQAIACTDRGRSKRAGVAGRPALTANRPSGRCSPPYGTAGWDDGRGDHGSGGRS